MPKLPTDTLPAAEFLVRHLYRAIDVTADARYFAVAEMENSGEDSWFWNDDNAKVLEFMSRPEVWRRFPRETAEILRFVQSMCHGPFIFRRVGSPRLDPPVQEGAGFRYVHSLMQVKCDLRHGIVLAGVRFHDERSAEHLLLAGSFVEFTYHGRRFRLAVDRRIGTINAEQNGHRLTLGHSGDVHFTYRWQERRLGRITYTYRIDASSMLIEVEAELDLEPGLTVADVVLTIGHANLDIPFYAAISAKNGAAEGEIFAAGEPGVKTVDAAGASYYAISQGFTSGDALAIHTAPRDPARLSGIATVVRQAGKLHSAGARYAFPGRHTGARLVAGEHKLITTGGFYHRVADYAGFLREAVAAKPAGGAACDLSISYDYGATINAMAKCFAVCAAGLIVPEPASLPEDLRSRVDGLLDHYFDLYVDRHEQQPNTIFSRELAFVILGVTTMYRATGSAEYRRRLDRLCEVLLDFEVRFDDGTGTPVSAFLMRKDSPRAAYVDCHSGVLLALTQAARHVDDPRLAAAIDRGLASYGLETCRVGGGLVDTIATLMIDEAGVSRTANAFWNFQAGLTLRFFAALRNAEEPALRKVAARHRDRIELFETVIRHQLLRSLSKHADGVEIRTAVPTTETNSETQPWVMLGLFGHPCD